MFLLLILIITLTLYSIFKNDSLSSIVDDISRINKIYLLVFFLMIGLYFALQGIYMKLTLKSLENNITLNKGIFYSMVEFYFSGITPSATGGQPVQLYYMTKDKIPVRKSYITLILNTIYFKVIVILLGIIALIFKPQYIFNYNSIYIVFFIISLLGNVLLVIVCYMLMFKQRYIKRILNIILKIGSKFKIFEKRVKSFNLEEFLDKYKGELKYLKNNKRTTFFTFVITFAQRLILFSTAYVVYRALGFDSFSYLDLLSIQVSVQLAAGVMPLPGGTVLSEATFKNIFINIFGLKYADVGMLLTRTFSFYIPLLICGLAIIINVISYRIKNKMLN